MMSAIPENLDALLTRRQTADALTEAGFPTSPTTLASKATRGGGPAYQMWGPRVIYRWGTSLEWAKARLSAPIRSTSELDAAVLRESKKKENPARCGSGEARINQLIVRETRDQIRTD